MPPYDGRVPPGFLYKIGFCSIRELELRLRQLLSYLLTLGELALAMPRHKQQALEFAKRGTPAVAWPSCRPRETHWRGVAHGSYGDS